MCYPHIRNHYLIHYVTKGVGYFEENGKRHKIRAGEIFVIHPNEIVSYYCANKKDLLSFCWVGFDGKCAGQYFEETGLKKTNRVVNLNNQLFLSTVLDALSHVENNGAVDEMTLNSYLLNCLRSIAVSAKKNNHHGKDSNDYVTKAIGYILSNYMKNISINEIAEHVNLERSYFYRIFKAYTKLSPERFLIEHRIDRAKELIKHDKYTFTQIANYVGICDVYYFSKLFKRVTGMTPSEYKKRK